MIVEPLTPRLTVLDALVLAALGLDTGLRADRVAQLVYGLRVWVCDTCESRRQTTRYARASVERWEALEPQPCLASLVAEPGPPYWCDTGRMHPTTTTTPEQRREVREILRGLEAVGKVTQRGGWWRLRESDHDFELRVAALAFSAEPIEMATA